MTKSYARKLKQTKVKRDRTVVRVQVRNLHDGTGREIYSVSLPRWAVSKLKLKRGCRLLVYVEGNEIVLEHAEMTHPSDDLLDR
jgi:hypothetical protein